MCDASMKLLKGKDLDFQQKSVPHSCAALRPYTQQAHQEDGPGTGDTQAAAPQAAKVGRRLLTGTSDTLFCLQGGRWLGPSFWLPQVSESLGTELHSSAAEVGLMTLLPALDPLDKGFLLPGT